MTLFGLIKKGAKLLFLKIARIVVIFFNCLKSFEILLPKYDFGEFETP